MLVPGLDEWLTVSARGLSGGDSEDLVGHESGAFDGEILFLGQGKDGAGNILQVFNFLRLEGDSDGGVLALLVLSFVFSFVSVGVHNILKVK